MSHMFLIYANIVLIVFIDVRYILDSIGFPSLVQNSNNRVNSVRYSFISQAKCSLKMRKFTFQFSVILAAIPVNSVDFAAKSLSNNGLATFKQPILDSC